MICVCCKSKAIRRLFNSMDLMSVLDHHYFTIHDCYYVFFIVCCCLVFQWFFCVPITNKHGSMLFYWFLYSLCFLWTLILSKYYPVHVTRRWRISSILSLPLATMPQAAYMRPLAAWSIWWPEGHLIIDVSKAGCMQSHSRYYETLIIQSDLQKTKREMICGFLISHVTAMYTQLPPKRAAFGATW